jgi:hypothetical protein
LGQYQEIEDSREVERAVRPISGFALTWENAEPRVVLRFWDRKIMCPTWGMLNVRFLWNHLRGEVL